MKILIAPDKFKGSLTAAQVCEIIESSLLEKNPQLEILTVPLADGGEGTCELLTRFSKGSLISTEVNDPLMRKIDSSYGISADGKIAFIEMANASGLQLLKPDERNCTITSTYGTGQLIRHALDFGVCKIILGIGGSATNDAGIGMAAALGFKLLTRDGSELSGIGADLISLNQIESESAHPKIKETEFVVLCDVDNPLYGTNGAAYVFAKQKGATVKDIEMLDRGLQNFAKIGIKQNCNLNFPGSGAAGGLGAGCRFFLSAIAQKGIDFITDFTDLESKLKQADVVLTGEGKVDSQTLSGKVVSGVAKLARRHNKKLIVIAGVCELDKNELEELGVSQVISLKDAKTSESEAMKNAERLLREKINKIVL